MVVVLVLLGALAVPACGGADYWYFESNTSGPNPGSTLIVVWMSDSPADDAEALEVGIARVELVNDLGRVPLLTETRTLDLLTLQHGVREKLAETNVDPADYDRIRVTLVEAGASGPRLRREGVWSPLDFASPGGHVVEIPYAIAAEADTTVEVQIDFNARTSLVTQNDAVVLDPRLDALDPSTAGGIGGSVLTALGAPVPEAIVVAYRLGLETRSARVRADGTYVLTPLAPGRYDLEVVGGLGGVPPRLDVGVVAGETTPIDFTAP